MTFNDKIIRNTFKANGVFKLADYLSFSIDEIKEQIDY